MMQIPRRIGAALAGALMVMVAVVPAQAQVLEAFRAALAEAVASDAAVAAFYRDQDFRPLWTGPDDQLRRSALVTALSRASEHGLPPRRYDLDGLMAAFGSVETEHDRARLEARVTRVFLQYARDISSGVLTPSRVDPEIVRTVPRPNLGSLLRSLAVAEPVSFLRNLAPRAPEYARLFRARQALKDAIANDSWGPAVPAAALKPGDTGEAVVALRNRLIAMGFMERTAAATYDGALQAAVQRFQIRHGLTADGVAGAATLRAINVPAQERLRSVVVAMERERWLNIDRGDRHIWVNLADFSSRIVDFDEITFETVSIIGARNSAQRTPEFSENMTFLEINPDWTLPRSILARSYWAALSAGGAPQLQIIDARGREVPRSAVNFARYTPRNFPFRVRQPPGPTNPLGSVKFMFPNPWAIYLHDTPARALFDSDVLTHSSGCIRLLEPEAFAYALLARQSDDPQGLFHRIRDSGRQTRIFLDAPVPTHLVYSTAFTDARGALHFRYDIYGRDAAIFRALVDAGVEIPAAGS